MSVSQSTQTTEKESPFTIDEIIISTTDKKGIITSGNDVFIRVSGYTLDQLIGSPHNIIRHPKMPRSVFKLLWDTISQDKCISAYVINRNAKGLYYWVFANVIPIEDGYLSVRIKPTTKIIETVKSLYAVMLSEEKKIGMDQTLGIAVSALQKLGFESYEHFMCTALIAEMKERDENAKINKKFIKRSDTKDSFIEVMTLIKQKCNFANTEIIQLFNKINQYQNIRKDFNQSTSVIINTCNKLNNLSLNMSVTANKLGKEGVSLTTVALTFQKSAKEIIKLFEDFSNEASILGQKFFQLNLSLAYIKLQTEMLDFFTDEILDQNKTLIQNRVNYFNQCKVFIAIVQKQYKDITSKQNDLTQDLARLYKKAVSLRSYMSNIELIRLGGKLEGARNVKSDESFAPYIKQLNDFIEKVDAPIHLIISLSSELSEVFKNITSQLNNMR